MTWGELVQKTNDWLSFKRKAAEGVSELPNLQDVCEWVERTLIARLESDNKVNGEKSIFQLAKKQSGYSGGRPPDCHPLGCASA